MGQVLYRKYRSKSFDEVIGQDHIKDTLTRALKEGKLSHAYLFTGPRGVGKTSVARVLAYAANDLPYESEGFHLDIIEIDAASNRRIDEIRDLREKINVAPSSVKYKIYIIDEVHMLTREAFNALLKTLEEPPAHVIFILATTEAHKVPQTILSRTQRFIFKPISRTDIADHLTSIAKKEKITISDDAIELLASHAEGSFRDSLSLLDQLSAYSSKISAEDVREALGLPPEELLSSLFESLRRGKKPDIIKSLNELSSKGVAASSTAKSLSEIVRTSLISDQGGAWEALLLKELLLVPASPNPDESLEIILLEMSSKAPEAKAITTKRVEKQSELQSTEDPVDEEEPISVANQKKWNFSIDSWSEIVSRISSIDPSLSRVLRMSNPQLLGDKLVLNFRFPLHEKKARQTRNVDLIKRIVAEMYGNKISVESRVDKTARPDEMKVETPRPKGNDGTDLKAINNIFGSAQVLES